MDFVGAMTDFWQEMVRQFELTFLREARYELFLEGLQTTVLLAFFSTLLGLLIGIVVAIVRVECIQTGKFKFWDRVLRAYIAVVRGTPIVVQLLIMFAIVLRSWDSAFMVAVIAFGLNSGAYVAEIIRAGILAVDVGQMEAGRSLGLTRFATMVHIVLPQAIKNILPALCNEFVSILKETSIVGLIPVTDLTKAGDLVRSRTYEPFFALISVAIVYFILVFGISALIKRLERRLARSDRSSQS